MRCAVVACWLALPGAGLAADPAAPARDNAARVWVALSGDRMRLDGQTYALAGVTCPDPATDQGRAAKALLNTFLRNGYVVCRIAGGQASCTKEGADFAKGMIRSGLCSATGAPPVADTPDARVRDSRPDLPARDLPARDRCDPAGPGRDFVDEAMKFACDRGVPASICDGVAGKRRSGQHVFRSDDFRAPGPVAPSFQPPDCR